MVFVGESIEFASKDERVCKPGGEYAADTIPTGKPRPGWFPCCDYPQWIARVRDSIRKYKADADIVFWTYNWGWAPEAERIALIETMPTDVSLLVTYEMFERYSVGDIQEYCSDYTIAFEGPGKYFVSETRSNKFFLKVLLVIVCISKNVKRLFSSPIKLVRIFDRGKRCLINRVADRRRTYFKIESGIDRIIGRLPLPDYAEKEETVIL
jgi:hypothetical protein